MPLKTMGTLPSEALSLIRSQGQALKTTLHYYRNKLENEAVTLDTARDIYMAVKKALETLGSAAVTPGLNEYAQQQYLDESVNVTADCMAVISSADPLWAFFLANAPTELPVKDPAAWEGGVYQDAIYTPESTESVTLRGLLSDILETIA